MFTRGDDGGNHLGVVTDCVDLKDEAMQAIARELGFSQTSFVTWEDGEVPFVRIFTPTREIPFAGHPLVGTGWVLHTLGPGGPERLACEIGEVGVTVTDDMAWIETDLNQRVESLNDPRGTAAAHALPPARAARRVMMPFPYLLLEVEEPDTVADATPDPGSFDDDDMVYLCSWESESKVKARFFAPGSGVNEDPATGGAAVALAAALQARGNDEGKLEISQGEEIGHPSTIQLTWGGGRVRIGGTVRRDEVRLIDY